MKKNYSFLYILIPIVVVAAVIAFFALQNHGAKAPGLERVDYNNFTFFKIDNAWQAQIWIKNQSYSIPFYYLPNDTENMNIDKRAVDLIGGFKYFRPNGIIYISLDPDSPSQTVIAAVELGRIIGNKYDIYNNDVRSSFYKPSATRDLGTYPLITCGNSSDSTLVIKYVLSNTTQVTYNDYCITVEASSGDELVKLSDALTYRLLKIVG